MGASRSFCSLSLLDFCLIYRFIQVISMPSG